MSSIHQKLANEAYKSKSADVVDDYVLDKSLSKRKIKVYHNPNTNQTIIANSGTRGLSSFNDIKNDVKLSLGLLNKKTSKRVQNSIDISKAAAEKYKGSELTNVGHSLGANVGAQTALKMPVGQSNAVTFNSGASPISALTGVKDTINCKLNPDNERCQKLSNRTEFNTSRDPISIATLANGVIKKEIVTPSSINTHSLDNFK